MKTILVTGANGQLGNSIRLLANQYPHYNFLLTDVETLDITDAAAVKAVVKDNQVNYILNCAAYTAVDKAEDNEELCRRLNCYAVQILGEAAHQAGAKIIHVSTDYVFSGTHHCPYEETDATRPVSAYGRTKLAGEEALLEVCPDAVIIRTAWLYSEFGSNFVKTVLRLGKERDEMGFVFDQIGTPTYAGDLAAAMLAIVAADEQEGFVPGVYHYSNEGVCSWYDFTVKILEIAGIECRIRPIETYEYPTRAIRPPYSVLNKSKIKATYGLAIPHWEASLRVCMQKM